MKSIQQSLMSMLKEHSAKRYLSAAVGMIAIATVLAVVWSLHINGITLASDDPTCGLQEHEHTTACYDWVMLDGTEEIDVTEGTEAAELVEGTEAVETTETAETAAAGVSAGTEDTETFESASGDTEDGAEAENNDTEDSTDGVSVSTESVLDNTEEGTESLMEDATEDATEGVTEEATESPQPGDTKVVDGFTYVYELVCGLEEHVHTDDCYPVDESEDGADGAEETSSSTNSEDAGEAEDSSSTVVKSTTSLRSTNNTDSEDEEELVSVSSINESGSEEETESEETTEKASEEVTEEDTEEESGILLASNNGSFSGSYYYADQIKLADAEDNLSDDYIIYTIIEGNYYVLSADGTLVQATSASSVSAVDAEGLYYIGTQEATGLVFDCWDAGSTFANYRWNLTDSGTDYVVSNSTTGHYLALENSTTETLTDGDGGYYYDMSGNETIVFTIDCSSDGEFYVELYDENGYYITTTSYYNAWFYGGASGSITGNDLSGSIAAAGTTYTVIVVREDEQFTFYYCLEDEVLNTITVKSSDFDTNVYLHVKSVTGIYTVSAAYASGVSTESKVTSYKTTEYDDITYEAFGIDSESSVSTKAGSQTLIDGSDITYTFSLSANKHTYDDGGTDVTGNHSYDTFALEMNNDDSNSYTALDLRGDGGSWKYEGDSEAEFTITSIKDVYKMLEDSGTDTNGWISALQSGMDCTVNVVREDDDTDSTTSFAILVSIKGYVTETINGEETSTYTTILEFTATISDSDFYGYDTNVYFYGEYCTISDLVCTDNTTPAGYTTYISSTNTDELYHRYTSSETAMTITAASDEYGWTGTVTLTDDTYTLLAASGEGVYDWKDSGDTNVTGQTPAGATVSTTFYFAKVREYTVEFDATDGGDNSLVNGNAYRYAYYLQSANLNSVGRIQYSNVTLVKTTYADAEGKCYVSLPYVTSPIDYNNAYFYDWTLQGWYGFYFDNNDEMGDCYYSFYNTGTGRNEWNYLNWNYDNEVEITADTIFYADWVAETYDATDGNQGGELIDAADTTDTNTNNVDNGYGAGGVDTDSFVSTYVFDYGNLINLLSTNVDFDAYSFSADSIKTHWNVISRSDTSFLGNLSMGIVFINSYAGSLNFPNRGTETTYNRSNYTRTSGIVSTVLNDTGLNLLSYLFDTDDDVASDATVDTSAYDISDNTGVLGKTYVGEGNYIFQYNDNTGYYYYDSARNAAVYNQSEERFYLYDYTVKVNRSDSESDFLPFNYISPDGTTVAYTEEESAINYWFGMKTVINFDLQDSVGTVTNKETAATEADYEYGNQSKGHNMKFIFMGDDDVWVYVGDSSGNEEYLLLDLGGIHGQIYGEIDFSTGLVTIVNNLDTNYTVDEATVKGVDLFLSKDSDGMYTVTDAAYEYNVVETYSLVDDSKYEYIKNNLTAGSFTLTMYYLERGASQSNLAVYYNIAPTYELDLLKADANTASSASTVDDLTKLENAVFTIYDVGTVDISTFQSSGYSSLKEYLAYLATTSAGSVYGTYYTNDTANANYKGTNVSDEDGFDYFVTATGFRMEHTYYIVETVAPSDYPLSGKVIELYMDTSGTITVNVYNSSGGLLETYTCAKDGTVTGTENTSGLNFIFKNGVSVSANNSESVLTVVLAILNAKEYELPTTGSTGVFPYERAGILLVLVSMAGLLIIALSEIVQRRRMRMNAYKRGYKEEKAGRENRYAGTRDRPQQRNRIYGRDASASFSDGSQERSRGTGPGTE